MKKILQERLERMRVLAGLVKENKQPISKKLNESKEDLIDYDVPEWSLSALINGDYSGLSDEDESKLNKFIQSVVSEYGNAHFLLGDNDGEDNLGFMYRNDIDNLGSNVYRVYINPSNLQTKLSEDGEWEAKQDLNQLQTDGDRIMNDPGTVKMS